MKESTPVPESSDEDVPELPPDAEDDDSDREDTKRLRSTSTVSNSGILSPEAAKQAQDANKSKKDKKRRQKKKRKR